MQLDLNRIGNNAVKAVRDQLQGVWGGLSDEDKAVIEGSAADAAALAAAALAAQAPAEKDAVAREQLQITAQLANLKAVGEGKAPRLVEDFWQAIGNTALGALGMAVKLAPLVAPLAL